MSTSRRPSSPRSSADAGRCAGFTLIEILVTTGVVSAVMASVVVFLLSTARHRREGEVRLEAEQGLRAAADVIERDVRLAGACLPVLGRFIALDGEDTGMADRLTVRIGARYQGACLRTNLTKAIEAGTSGDLAVDHAEGFEAGQHAYLSDLGGNGEFFHLKSANAAGKTIAGDHAFDRAYPIGSTVFVLEERSYSLGADLRGRPMMLVQADGGDAWPMAYGIVGLDAQYTLRRGACPRNCDTTTLPRDDDEWRLVTDVAITLRASLPSAVGPGGAYQASEVVRAKPRNLLP